MHSQIGDQVVEASTESRLRVPYIIIEHGLNVGRDYEYKTYVHLDEVSGFPFCSVSLYHLGDSKGFRKGFKDD